MRIVFVFLALIFPLFSSEKPLHPDVMVEGCVDARTGHLVVLTDDVGFDEFPVPLYYNSGQLSWDLIPHRELVLVGSKGAVEKKKKNTGKKKRKKRKDKNKNKESPIAPIFFKRAHVSEPSGDKLTYHVTSKNEYRVEMPAGITNVKDNSLSASTWLHNQKLVIGGGTATITTADGMIRVYKKTQTKGVNHHFLIHEEVLPNGQTVSYTYDHERRIEKISCGDVWCQFHYFHDTPNVMIKTSNEDVILYAFTDPRTLVSANVGGSQQNFLYEDKKLSRMENSSGAFLRVNYDEKGRVKALRSGSGKVLHMFSYFQNMTEIAHEDGTKTHYYFNSKYYPEKIEILDRDERPTQSIEMDWSEKGTLLQKVLIDDRAQVVETRTWVYDEVGNPVEETLNGKVKTRVFDEKNRLIEEISDEVVEYNYEGDSHLVSRKTKKRGGKILEQLSFSYDEGGLLQWMRVTGGSADFCLREVEITGSLSRPDRVIERAQGRNLRITEYSYSKEDVQRSVYNGDGSLCLEDHMTIDQIQQPWENFCSVDLEKGHGYEIEKDCLGRVVTERSYDNEGTLISEKRWEYNALFPTKKTDGFGHQILFAYNTLGQKTGETVSGQGQSLDKTYTYNDQGRLSEYLEGEILTAFAYDRRGRLIEQKEEDCEGNLLSHLSIEYTERDTLVTQLLDEGSFTYPLKKKIQMG